MASIRCTCIEIYRYLDIVTDAVPNVKLFDIERKTALLIFTVEEINCRKKGRTNTLTFSELGTSQDIKKKDNVKRGCFSLKIKKNISDDLYSEESLPFRRNLCSTKHGS